MSLSRFEEAITDFERALRMDPLNAVAMTGKGEALGKIGKFEEALEVLDLVLRTGSNHTDAHWNRGNILRDQRKLHEAIESYDRALSIQPNFTLARQSKGFALLLSGDLNNGLPLLMSSTGDCPNLLIENLWSSLVDRHGAVKRKDNICLYRARSW